MTERAKKLMSADAAVASLKDGQTLIIGGSLFHSKPMDLVRAIIRKGVRDLTVIAIPQASIDVDLLIAAGCVAEVRVPYLGFEYLGLAMNYRRFAAAGRIRVWECDETQLMAGLEATARDLPSALVKTGVGTDLPKLNPDLKLIDDPITGEPMVAVGAIRTDMAIIHAPSGDAYGNLHHTGYSFGDRLIAEVTKRGGGKVVASVGEVVPLSHAERDPFRTGIAHFLVDVVVEGPWGAHPCSCAGTYQYDEAHLKEFLAASRKGEDGVKAYLDQYVYQVPDQLAYLDRVLTPSKMVALRRQIYV